MEDSNVPVNRSSSGDASIAKVNTAPLDNSLGSMETEYLDSVRLQVFSDDAILECLFKFFDTSELTTLRQVCKSFYVGSLTRWQAEFTLSIHGNMEKFEDYLKRKQLEGSWPKLGFPNVKQELSQAPRIFGLHEKWARYSFQKVRIYGFLIRCSEDVDIWEDIGQSVKDLTIVNGMFICADIKTVLRSVPNLQTLRIYRFIPFFSKARHNLIQECLYPLKSSQANRTWPKFKRFYFTGSEATYLAPEITFIIGNMRYVQAVSIDWCDIHDEVEWVLEWAHLLQPHVFNEKIHCEESGMIPIPNPSPDYPEYKIHPYPIPQWMHKWAIRATDERFYRLPGLYGNPQFFANFEEVEMRMDPHRSGSVCSFIGSVAHRLKRLSLTGARFPWEAGFQRHDFAYSSGDAPKYDRSSALELIESVKEIYSRMFNPSCPLGSDKREFLLDFVQLSNLEITADLVRSFNFLLITPCLKWLVIKKTIHSEETEVEPFPPGECEHAGMGDQSLHKCSKCTREVFSKEISGSELVSQSDALRATFVHLSMEHFRTDLHFNSEALVLLEKWMPNVESIMKL